MDKILAINSGSSSFKYKLFSLADESVLASGLGDRIGIDGSTFSMKLADGTKHEVEVDLPNQEVAVQTLLDWLKEYGVIADLKEIVGVGHRIVNGGELFPDSAIIDKDNIHKVFDLTNYAPLHNPAEGREIQAFMNILPDVPQVGVFDTSFHQSMDEVHYIYSLPYEYYEKYKARKYGAHGTSVRYVSGKAAELLGKDLKDLKLVVCHLGSGASVTAVKDGKCYDTSMGFSPLAGVTMGTRSGDVDPSVLQYIMKKEGITDFNEMIDILNHKSGLLGLSGISSDMRDIRNSDDKRARLAEAVFINRVVRYVGSYIAEMGGADAVVFTAGIGEHDDVVREGVMKSLSFMGVDFDDAANKAANEGFITKEDSKLAGLIIPTDEELMIERDVVRLAKLK
ncbi:acetate kinase [Lactobacillus delbrueckii subsp. bulgaricus]|uniref:Acetate kinase n=1 Tax=Lactobacillus delbrueckii subsp. bulgaricus (strain ATCC 11842 / DSM 20081 / BCRC 10696 / JCM 1002 / NBRC 13953 / NCIMB 11778 / NCTC 12712 / WDCM 00102 / Lb 14) TaxID=390333 RepID=Q1GAY6_LACDA|nr:acetate kinase [Lactobacillus delbrueckii]KRN39051.1 acetate kinase [Lactobacillus delbrueckii subsp. bulgaricus ATCC 11842 = JCM 1002]MDG9748136.1 acetate kinase [Lactobacillus delbrueckii subsp. bulgaricus ATCC 11842 = JCM 1002]GEB90484.1 acetate kinase [Lactobacillus delbrueckii subsp. bulgaricus]CAI97515.1 Acetate kinase [Lactobacillus delbrueckii subsp. bulgaricus ATCC 11842 = JCM 1002]